VIYQIDKSIRQMRHFVTGVTALNWVGHYGYQ